ncbi:carboxynorspermidine decarboxylase [bacterium]|nr:carboxynorspermidine decarboxylase [bacterium]
MDHQRFSRIDLKEIPTPCYLVDEELLENNLKLLERVQQDSGRRILLALKAFSMFSTFPLIRRYLRGVSASSPHEARLGKEEFKGEVHTYAPAYSEADMDELVQISDVLIFNSFGQWGRYRSRIPNSIRCGLRINPGYSEIKVDLYNPCAKKSRLGIVRSQFEGIPEGISGLHFHAMCEQDADTLERIMEIVERDFSSFLHQIDWINLGDGHHITRPGYNVDLLIRIIRNIREKYGLEVFLEPGEAVALNCGILVASVIDIVENDIRIAILDTSAEAHMPDVLAMPYRPEIIGAAQPDKSQHTYRLAGPTCLAGDVIGDYSFDEPLLPGSKLVFLDMAHYSMVKNNTFNGVCLPSILIQDKLNRTRIVRQFKYEDYKSRLS